MDRAKFGLLCVLGVSACGAWAQGADHALTINNGVRSIAITATDRVVNQADMATVHIGYLLYGPNHDAAYATGGRVSQAILKALSEVGVPAEAIESQEQSLEATDGETVKMFPVPSRAGHAFTVKQSWTARVAAKDGARVLDVAVRAGANDSGTIDWSLRDANVAQAAAAARAIQRARSQAEAMAHGLNVRLGTLLYASNEVNAAVVAPAAEELLRAPAKMAMGMPPPPPPPPMAINPQQIETAATVYAVFAIE